MNVFWPLALITFKEGVRNRALYGIALLALLMLAATQLVCGMIMRDVGKVAIDMALSTVSFAGVLLVLFVGINLMAKDLDRRTIYMVLSRPISRSQYIVGKFAGVALLVLAATAFLGGAAIVSIGLTKVLYPTFFASQFAWSTVLVALVLIALMLVLLTALSFLFASLTSTSFVTLILTVVSYVIGQSLTDVKALVEAPRVVGIEIPAATVKLVQFAYYVFPNLSLFDVKTQAAYGLTLPAPYLGWIVFYGVVYTALAVTAAALLFRRREFP
jgi:ABC-type transport system involved in multi-copper enzyme maturation permease subunit